MLEQDRVEQFIRELAGVLLVTLVFVGLIAWAVLP